jgi:hypothetical protein
MGQKHVQIQRQPAGQPGVPGDSDRDQNASYPEIHAVPPKEAAKSLPKLSPGVKREVFRPRYVGRGLLEA